MRTATVVRWAFIPSLPSQPSCTVALAIRGLSVRVFTGHSSPLPGNIPYRPNLKNRFFFTDGHSPGRME